MYVEVTVQTGFVDMKHKKTPRVHFNVLSESPLFNNFGYIFLGCSPFPRRTHRVRTAGMSLSKKNLSRNSCIKRL